MKAELSNVMRARSMAPEERNMIRRVHGSAIAG